MKNKLTNMKKVIVFLLVLAAAGIAKAQHKSFGAKDKWASTYYTASSTNAVLPVALVMDSNTKWIDYNNILPNQPLDNYVFLHGTKKASVLVSLTRGLDFKNYRYNIIQDDSIYLVTNAMLSGDQDYGASSYNRTMIKLGEFNVENKKLTIEVYNINQRNKVSTTTIYNKPFKPAEIMMTSLQVTAKGQSFVEMTNLKEGFSFKINDGEQRVSSIVLCIKQTDITFIYHVFVKNLATGKTVPISNNWLYGGIEYNGSAVPNLLIDASFFSDPGNYELVIRPQLPSDFIKKEFVGKATTMRFTVLKSDRVYSVKDMVLITLGIILLAVIIIFYNRYSNRKKIIEQQREKDLAEVQLSAVRSQLNPHFLFNALAGIQNLMNKNEVDQANRYLAKFARLTRNVLNSDELINIAGEIALLDDYLQMEQLRFGFIYNIDIEKDIDAENVEMPSMLLQPFVENAVKYGVADMGANGKIAINITRQSNSLILSISDNGNGFDINQQKEGLGIPLSKRRITLLNEIYQQSPVLLDIRSGVSGTEIILTLNRWL